MTNQSIPVSVLLDNSAMSFGMVAHGIRVPVKGSENKLFLIQAKPVRSPDEQWLRDQIEALPTVARLIKEEVVKAHTYSELRMERWRSPSSFPHDFFGDIFHGMSIAEVRPAVERSAFFQSDMRTYVQPEAFAEFCRWLLDQYSEAWSKAPFAQELGDWQAQNLRNIERYRTICRRLDKKHHPDAFHLWTGEVNGLTHFVTMDRKFSRAMLQVRELNLSCVPILPTDLLDQLGVVKRDPLPFVYGARYLLNGLRYD